MSTNDSANHAKKVIEGSLGKEEAYRAEVCDYIASATADPDHPPTADVYRPGTKLVPRREINPSARPDQVAYYIRPLYPSFYTTDRAIVEAAVHRSSEPPTGIVAFVDYDGDFNVMPFPVWRLKPVSSYWPWPTDSDVNDE